MGLPVARPAAPGERQGGSVHWGDGSYVDLLSGRRLQAAKCARVSTGRCACLVRFLARAVWRRYRIMGRPSRSSLIGLWLAWGSLLFLFQTIITARVTLQRPDYATDWTAQVTTAESLQNQPYLNEPWLNRQVAWDSEFYLAIAVGGYADPDASGILDPDTGARLPFSYHFFPVYPYLMRYLAVPLRVFHLNPIATASLAGVIISLLGTLGGVLALWELTRESLGPEGAWRAVFYLLVFPTSFFLAMVYTEGLFIGLVFGALVLARRGHWLEASGVAAVAAGTRAVGVALVVPLAWTWFQAVKGHGTRRYLRPAWRKPGGVVAPLVVFLLWRQSHLGQQFLRLHFFFGRGPLQIADTLHNWHGALTYAASNPQSTVYFGLELVTMGLALVASLALLPRYPAEALFSLAAWTLMVFSGAPGNMSRYMLVLPTTYIFLSRLGCSPAFDRAWSLASILLLGMSAMLFVFDMWVG